MTAAWLFGKMPAHGDFVARGLDATDRDDLDDWLTASLSEAREEIGDDFARCWDTAPPLRFTGEGRAGALVASIDRAGRRYPLVVERYGGARTTAACESALGAALGEGWNADRLYARVAAIDHEPGDGRDWRWYCVDAGDATAFVRPGRRPARLILDLLLLREDVR